MNKNIIKIKVTVEDEKTLNHVTSVIEVYSDDRLEQTLLNSFRAMLVQIGIIDAESQNE